MAMEVFDLGKLANFDDARIMQAFQEELKYAALSCHDRPGDKSPRKVTLEMTLIPVQEPNSGGCEGINVKFKAKAKVPERKSREYSLNTNRAGQLIFSTTNAANAAQKTFEDAEEEKGRKGVTKAATKPKAVPINDDDV